MKERKKEKEREDMVLSFRASIEDKMVL